MIYAAIPVILAMVCLWLGRRMLTALLIFFYLSIEGFLKLLSNYNRIVHVGFDLIVLTLAGFMVLQSVVQRRAHLDELPYTRLVLVYSLWMVLQLLNPFSPGLIQSIASFKVHLTMVPLYFIGASLFRDPRDVVKFLFGLTAIAIIPYGVSLIQYALGPQSFLDLSPRYWANISYYHEFRPFGTSAVPGGSSAIAYLVLPFTMVLLVSQGVRQSMRPIAVISILLAAGTFVVSGVRQLLLGCVLIILVMGVLMASRRSGRVAVVVLAMAVLGFAGYVGVATFLRPMSTEAVMRDPRSPEIWRQREVTARIFTLTESETYLRARQNPINIITRRATRYPFGAGLGRTGSALGTFKAQVQSDPDNLRVQTDVGWTADNFFADMIVEGGIPALVMLLWILVGMMRRAIRLARTATEPIIATSAAALAGFYFSILIMSYGSQPLLANPITAFFWFFSGMCAAMFGMEDRARAQEAQVDAFETAMEDGLAPEPAR